MTAGPGVVLSYRALGLGDLLTAVPALRALRRAHPGHRHVLAAPAWLRPMVDTLDAVHEHLAVGELDVPATSRDVDVAVNLHGSGPESHRVLEGIGAGRRLAFHHRDVPWSSGAPRWDPEEHEVHRWCRMLEEQGIRADPSDLDIAAPRVELPAELIGATVIHPGAKAASRRWPADRFADVAWHEAQQGRRVVVTGSLDELPLARAVAWAAGLGESAVAAGRTDLAGLAAIVAAADRVVCGDTGVAHLATALSTPSVVIFGPTSPAAWGPPAERRSRHRALWAGRTGDPLASEPDPGLLRISVDDVLSELRELDEVPVAGHGG